MRCDRGLPTMAMLALALATLALAAGATGAGAAVSPAGSIHSPGAEEIAPYSKHPSGPEPYAACPEPTARRASCMAAVVPTAGGEPLAGPELEGSGQLGGFSPQDIRSAYGLPAEGGAGLTVAITIAYDNPNAEADLATYRSQYGLPPCTTAGGCFRKVDQNGAAGPYPTANEGWALESSLDLDMVSAACPRCHILLVEADSNELEDLEQAVDRAVALGADVVSNSWDTEEFAGETAEDPHFTHPGTPLLFASGDEGYGVYYPASSPDTVAVGGTSLTKSTTPRGWEESAWSGAGSGCSAYEEKPAWQHDTGCANRTVADVAAVADPQTPVSVYDSYPTGGWRLLGGTSVATPIVAGVEALSSGAFRASGPSAFARAGNGGGLFDVTDGENGICGSAGQSGFSATYLCQGDAGYDGPTGWGTPRGPLDLPIAITEGADVESTATATLHGSVAPHGVDTTYRFEYGTTDSYGHSVPAPEGDAGAGSGYVDVSTPVAGLEGQTPYHYRLTALNSGGTFHGVDRTFGTSPPEVVTGAPREVHAFSATLQGSVDPEGLDTRYYFEYGLSNAYDRKAPAFAPSAGSGLTSVGVSTYVLGLRPGRVYHVRIVGVNSAGRTVGADRLLVTEPARWTAESLPQPPESGFGHEAFGVSCTQTDSCIAVGGNWSLEVHTRVTLAELWNGTSWSVMDTPNPSGLEDGWQTDRYAVLDGVSCASGSACVAVGRFRDPSETVKPLAEIWDGSAWKLVKPPVPPGNGDTGLEGVSCASATDCIAVGWTEGASEVVRTLAERWNGSNWTILSTPAPAGAVSHRFESVSCSSAAACTAVGALETAAGVEMTLAERWDGSAWTVQSTVSPTGNEAWNALAGVSCPAAGACTAVGTHYELSNGAFTPSALVERWDGSTWSTQAVPALAGSEEVNLFGVSCAAVSACTAVGSYEAPGADTYAEVLGVRWDGAAWSALDMIGLADPIGWWHERWLYGVSCPEAEGCTAVGRGLAAPEGYLSPYQALGEHEVVPPFASFTSSPGQPAKGTAVEFDASGTVDPGHTIQSYEWDFGDGTTGSGETPAHAYAHAGDYAATLKVTDERGRSGEVAHLVTVTGTPPSAAFTRAPASPVAGDQVEFDAQQSGDADGSVANYEWDFGDGTRAFGETATHTYARAGHYQVKLSVTDNEGLAAKATQTVVVADAPPHALFAVGTPSPTTTVPTVFDGSASGDPDGTLAGWEWDFGDGAHGNGASVSHTYARAGEYVVKLTVTDDEGETATAMGSVKVTGLPPHAEFSLRTSAPTASEPVAFDASSSGDADGSVVAYSWDFGDGGQGGGPAPSHTYSTPGEYRATLTVTDDEGMTATATHTVRVAPAPVPDLEIRRASAGRGGQILVVVQTNGAGRVDASASTALGEGSRRARPRRVPYGRSAAELTAAGQARLTISPGRRAAGALRRHGHLPVTVVVTFTPRSGGPVTKRRAFRVGG